MARAIRSALLAALLATAAVAGWLGWFSQATLPLPATPYEFTVRPGSSLKALSRQLTSDGMFAEPASFWLLGRVLGKSDQIRAGTYRLDRPVTPVELIDKLARGDVLLVDVRFVEGTTFRQWLDMLAADPMVRHTIDARSEEQVGALVGLEGQHPEGWFFPDTYRFTQGSSDTEILRRAHGAMVRRLADNWAARAPDLPLATPYEALTLASIIEKETGLAAERGVIASVFVNRLRLGMRLQTDPTVIYGMGDAFDGNIRKRDLTADTPWNTYTRDGLPPTPIAMPGAESLRAATHPAQSDFLYFVARGDGSHEFSRSLEEHNRAVARYQLHPTHAGRSGG